MPVIPDDELGEALEGRAIAGITVDTSIFVQKRFRFEDPLLTALARLRSKPVRFMLSHTVVEETQKRLSEEMTKAQAGLRRELGSAIGIYGTASPTRAEIMEMVTGGYDPATTARQRIHSYLDKANCERVDDMNTVSSRSIFEAYFAGNPPFGTGKKKFEFPDAMALLALEDAATRMGSGILVISSDNDWRSFCERSGVLYHIDSLERALDLLNAAAFKVRENDIEVVRTVVHEWLDERDDGRPTLRGAVETMIEAMSFDVEGTVTFGEMEAYAAGAQLEDIDWPERPNIDIIDVEFSEDPETIQVTVSLPLVVRASFLVELGFSVWDGIDKESISMGGRSEEIEEEISVTVTVTLDVRPFAEPDFQVDFLSANIDFQEPIIDLGEVDVFLPQDYDEEA